MTGGVSVERSHAPAAGMVRVSSANSHNAVIIVTQAGAKTLRDPDAAGFDAAEADERFGSVRDKDIHDAPAFCTAGSILKGACKEHRAIAYESQIIR